MLWVEGEEMKKTTNTEIAIKEQGNSPAEMIRIAVSGKADLDKLEKLLGLQERWEANEAKKAYHKAMADFKADPPKIGKDKKVAYKEVRYNHATLANVTEKINEALSKHGLSASWTTKQTDQVFVTCKITHILGHSEETTLSALADGTGSKNAIQAIGSTITYLERYTLLALTGLATYDMDDDAQSIGVEYISEQQLSTVIDILVGLGMDTPAKQKPFLDYIGAESLEKIPTAKYQQAIEALKQKKARQTK